MAVSFALLGTTLGALVAILVYALGRRRNSTVGFVAAIGVGVWAGLAGGVLGWFVAVHSRFVLQAAAVVIALSLPLFAARGHPIPPRP